MGWIKENEWEKRFCIEKKAIPKLGAKKFETNGINLKIKEFSLYCKLGKEINVERIVFIRAANIKE